MKAAPAALVDIRRGGQDADTIELIDDSGRVLLLHAHGALGDEKLRVREQALTLLCRLLRKQAAVAPTPGRSGEP